MAGVVGAPPSPRKGKRGDATTAGEKTVGFSPKEWQLRGDARGGILNTPLAALWVLSRTGKYRTAGSYRKDLGVEKVPVSRTRCVPSSTSQSVVISRTHCSNPTFSFRPAEKKTCR